MRALGYTTAYFRVLLGINTRALDHSVMINLASHNEQGLS
jgi:hypothetical protein